MRRGTLVLLLLIIVLAAGSSFVVFWPNTAWHGVTNPFIIKRGLDLQGGISVVMVPASGQRTPTQEEMNNVRTQIERRVNGGLGVNEPVVRTQTTGNVPSILVELPGLTSGNQQEVIKNTLLKTGLLEFWDTGPQGFLPENTDFDPTQYAASNGGTKPLFTGADLDPNKLQVAQDQQTGGYAIDFEMQGAAFGRLSNFTAAHQQDYLTITLDKKVVTSAVIQTTLPGRGEIMGRFTQDQAQYIVNVLKYGALPVTLQIASQQQVDATLGESSIQRSITAAIVGLSIVALFMLIYYRLPGLLADLALVLYSLLTLALFKVIGVTLTLAGIAGFILSIGMAVDANVLIFERLKEELRAGRLLADAIAIGWRRAWPSIRDSNCSTLITCAVLYGFGQNFGATIIVGFATTLFLGVVISMFTAIVVTRTFLNLLVPTGVIGHPASGYLLPLLHGGGSLSRRGAQGATGAGARDRQSR